MDRLEFLIFHRQSDSCHGGASSPACVFRLPVLKTQTRTNEEVSPWHHPTRGTILDCQFGLAIVPVPAGLQSLAGPLSGAIPPERAAESFLNPEGIPENDGWQEAFRTSEKMLEQ